MVNDGVYDLVNIGCWCFFFVIIVVVGVVGVGFIVVFFIKFWNFSVCVKFVGVLVVVDISVLQEGQCLIVEWCGQLIWIVKWFKVILDVLYGLDGCFKDFEFGEKDQQLDYVLKQNFELCLIKLDIFVLVGLCMYLGCLLEMVVEIWFEFYDLQWKGGYFCFCYKLCFDMFGCVFKDVLVLINLKVFVYYYQDDNIIIIGVDLQGVV